MSPPTSIVADCSQDVSYKLRKWLNNLSAGTSVLLQPSACYLVDEGINLRNPQGLTIYGGTFRDDAVTPDRPHTKGYAVFTVIGGSHVAIEATHILGQNHGGYDPTLAFAAGIDLEGTSYATIRSVTITGTFGDGISLSPLRGGADHDSGTILGPTSDVTIRDVTIEGVGRQGVTLASVSGAQLSDVVFSDTGLNTFDVEADQWDEGANDITIDGCSSSGGGLFFANGGAGSWRYTQNITVEHCSMAKPQAGDAILVYDTTPRHPRGPFQFISDNFECGSSASVACIQLKGADVTVSDSRLLFPPGTIHESVYHVVKSSTALFRNDVVKGYGTTGHVSHDSTLQVSGGKWTPTSA